LKINPDAAGNRYPICFTSVHQAKKSPVSPSADEAGPDFSSLDERYGKRRKKNSVATWATQSGETAHVSTGKGLAYVKRSYAAGGLILNPNNERHSLALAKILLE